MYSLVYQVHNAFRSPGTTCDDELGKPKAEVYRRRYEQFRSGLSFHTALIDESSGEALRDVTFAFVCVDKGSARAEIFDLLISHNIPFIDVGMGLNRKHSSINGVLRTTVFPETDAEKIRDACGAPLKDNPDDVYRNHIQISELNALNACLAIIRFKQLRGFYYDNEDASHILFEVGDLSVTTEP